MLQFESEPSRVPWSGAAKRWKATRSRGVRTAFLVDHPPLAHVAFAPLVAQTTAPINFDFNDQ